MSTVTADPRVDRTDLPIHSAGTNGLPLDLRINDLASHHLAVANI